MFFQPSNNSYRSNLSKVGKVYNKKPSLSYVSNGIRTYNSEIIKFNPADWEIVEYVVISKSVLSDEFVREQVKLLKETFLNYKTPQLELPSESVIEKTVHQIIENVIKST